MSSNNPIDLYECRLLKARGALNNSRQLNRIALGLDIVSSRGRACFYDGRRIITFECTVPWKTWKLETLQDSRLLEDCLRGLVYKLEAIGLGIVDTVGIVVPHSFTAFQKSMIPRIAQNAGIRSVSTGTAGHYGSMSKFLADNQDKLCLDFICTLREKDFEFALIESGNGVYESLGTVGLKCDDGWNSLTGTEFRKRITGEVSQFLKELGFTRDASGKLEVNHNNFDLCRAYIDGLYSPAVEELLTTLVGAKPERNILNAAAGGLVQALVRMGSDFAGNCLKLTSIDRNIWIGLGDNGEKAIVLKRYHCCPIAREASLLLSTETQLRVYEGNYFNPAFDCLLAEISLDALGLEEGKEIDCRLDMESDGSLSLSITNHKKEIVLQHYAI